MDCSCETIVQFFIPLRNRMSGVVADPRSQLLRSWDTETDFGKRNTILQQMTEQGLFPEEEETKLETSYGLYPDLPDPQSKVYNRNFLKKLLRKQEFLEDRQKGIQDLFENDDEEQDLFQLLQSDASACGPSNGKQSDEMPSVTPFELSPTQRFIGRFLSPQTPYNSALLFHGVGVGKTCSGVTVAENFLQMYPKQQVIIIAPPTIQAGWLREIFNFNKLVLGTRDGEPNTHNGCTGNTYLRLAAMEYERNIDILERKIKDVIKRRYKILGYLQFFNYVEKYLGAFVSKDLKVKDKERYNQERYKVLNKRFSGGMIIVDEAHNLRDLKTESVEVKPAGKSLVTSVTTKASPEESDEEELQRLAAELAEYEEQEKEEISPKLQTIEESNNEESITTENLESALSAFDGLLEEEKENEVNTSNLSQNDELGEEENEVNITNVAVGGGNSNEDEEEEISLESVEGPSEEIKEEFADEEADAPLTAEDKADIIKGKRTTPVLREILQAADGMKFLMLTATPMYNEYREIVDLLNLLLLNDKRATIRENHIFNQNGSFADGGRELLGRVASSYVSFMRGENPLAFPIRLNPLLEESQQIKSWPSKQPDGAPISEEQRRQVVNLPYVGCPVYDEYVKSFQGLCRHIIAREKLTIPSTDKLIMAGNFLYPAVDDAMDPVSLEQKVGKSGFTKTFSYVEKSFEPLSNPAWMASDYMENEEEVATLELHSPKAKYVVDRVKTTKGVCFVYSRFVETGALTLALILEANGYTCASRKKPLLRLSGPITNLGRQCALCPLREAEHVNHEFEPKTFVPAKYVLLTGEKDYSPNNKAAIELATHPDNFDGKMVKIILGSTIASEGIDLKYIRELFVFDSWYHLSKLEQVIGRGIRYKSHCALPPLQRNCTINLLILTYPEEDSLETIDMYQYRNGFLKARQVGQVTRVLKEYALDCNLNKELILIQGLGRIQQQDGQGVLRDNVDVNDAPYTNICDWLETCEYTCEPDLDLDKLEEDIDYSTYDEYAAKWRTHEIKRIIRKVFEDQPWRRFDDIQNRILASIPSVAKAAILEEIVGNRSFRIRVGNQEGYIIYKNGFYLFQPERLWDTYLPLSLRMADFPVKRDMYEPIPIEMEKPAPKLVAKPTAVTNLPEAVSDVGVAEAALNETIPAEEEEEFTQYRSFWDEIVKWSNSIKEGRAGKATPKTIENLIQSRYLALGNTAVRSILYTFEMVGQLYEAIKTKETLREPLANVLLEFVWDEFMTTSEIQMLNKLNTPEIMTASAENRLTFGSKSIFRFVDPRKPNTLLYMCDGKPCAEATKEGAEENDPLSKLKADKTTTTLLYGLNIPNKGKIVFKSNDAVDPSKKEPASGRLCYTVPNTERHIEMLEKIGVMAKGIPEIGSDLNLNKEKTAGIATPPRLCTLANLALRLIDKVNVSKSRPEKPEKRAFYRPIAAIKTKHKGKESK